MEGVKDEQGDKQRASVPRIRQSKRKIELKLRVYGRDADVLEELAKADNTTLPQFARKTLLGALALREYRVSALSRVFSLLAPTTEEINDARRRVMTWV